MTKKGQLGRKATEKGRERERVSERERDREQIDCVYIYKSE